MLTKTKNNSSIRLYVTIFVLALVEFGIFHRLRIFGVRPEVLLIATLFFGFNFGAAKGAEVGLVSGVLKGIFGITPLGVYVFSFVVIGLLAGILKNKLIKGNFFTQFFISNLAVYFISGVYFIYMRQISDGGLSPEFLKDCLYKGLYTGALSPIFFFSLSRVFKIDKNYQECE